MRKRARIRQSWSQFIRSRRGDESQASFGALIGFTGSYISSWETTGVVPPEDTVRRAAQSLGDDDPTPWLVAAGYVQPDQVSEESPPYGSASENAEPSEGPLSDTIELVVKINRQTGDVVSVQTHRGEKKRP